MVLLTVGYLTHTFSIDGLRGDVDIERDTNDVVEAILVDACAANDLQTLAREQLLASCRLARAGEIDAAIKTQIDDEGAGSADTTEVREAITEVAPAAPPPSSVATAVEDYLSTYDFDVEPEYRDALRTDVESALRTLGVQPPTRSQITAAVAAYLVTNPPDDGAPGRGLVTAALDDCDVRFSYTDGTSMTVGPICGRDGADAPPVTDEQIDAAVARYCEARNGCRGSEGPQGAAGPQGPEGPAGYPSSITLADGQRCTDPDGDRRYTCSGGQPDPAPPEQTPEGDPPITDPLEPAPTP